MIDLASSGEMSESCRVSRIGPEQHLTRWRRSREQKKRREEAEEEDGDDDDKRTVECERKRDENGRASSRCAGLSREEKRKTRRGEKIKERGRSRYEKIEWPGDTWEILASTEAP